MGIVLNYCQYGVLYLGSYYNTGPYIHFPHFGNSNLGKLPNDMPIDVSSGFAVVFSQAPLRPNTTPPGLPRG